MDLSLFMKMKNAKKVFTDNHPKIIPFLNVVSSTVIREDSIIEITVKNPDEEPLTANIKVKQSDLEFFQSLREMSKLYER